MWLGVLHHWSNRNKGSVFRICLCEKCLNFISCEVLSHKGVLTKRSEVWTPWVILVAPPPLPSHPHPHPHPNSFKRSVGSWRWPRRGPPHTIPVPMGLLSGLTGPWGTWSGATLTAAARIGTCIFQFRWPPIKLQYILLLDLHLTSWCSGGRPWLLLMWSSLKNEGQLLPWVCDRTAGAIGQVLCYCMREPENLGWTPE